MARALDSIRGEGAGTARFKPASNGGKPVRQAAGPFDVKQAQGQNGDFGSILVTGLLVIYPAFATVAAIVVGLSLSSGGA